MTEKIKLQNLDWDSLGFTVNPSRSMFIAETDNNGNWKPGKIVPFGNISISPASGVMNYGQGIFEGIKAFRSTKDRIVFFRLEENARRFAASADRIVMPPVPEKMFIDTIHDIVIANEDYIPPTGHGALYVRPILCGSGPILGVAPAPSYSFIVFVSPVGPYFKGGVNPLNLMVTNDYHRAAPKGIGNAKAIGNYSASLYPRGIAKENGFDEVIYLSAANGKYVEEVGSANLFSLKGNVLKTPRLAGSILPGITRKSVLHLAKEKLGLIVQETDLPLEEMLTADEVFCTGTAVVVCPIGRISNGGVEHVINNNKMGEVTLKLRTLLTDIQTERIPDEYGWITSL